jgi:hypothetical protein
MPVSFLLNKIHILFKETRNVMMVAIMEQLNHSLYNSKYHIYVIEKAICLVLFFKDFYL